MFVSRCVVLPLALSFVKQLTVRAHVSRFAFRRFARSLTTPDPICKCHQSSIMFLTEERGSPYAPDYRVFFKNENGPISPLHDIPLYANKEQKIFNMVVEIPRWSNAKMEISLSEPLNPIKQDVKKGALRFVSNVFPHHGYIWNYGALPQTWENPQHVEPTTNARGDNDPIDVIEIGQRVASRGEVIQVKVVGTLALIDEGETDWKLIAIDVRDPRASAINDVADVETHFPGLLKATVEWFKLYKVPDGKPQNVFAFDDEAKGKAFALNVIEEVHEFWKSLVQTTDGEISRVNTSVAGSAGQVDAAEAASVLSKAPAFGLAQPIPESVDKWHFLSLK